MTVAVAWIRTIRDCEELVFVTDSRLSGDGRNFDACPKIMTLPRTDCAIAFAGYTGHAFPMMEQLSLAIESYRPLQLGSLNLFSLKSHALKIFDSMSELIVSSPLLSSNGDTGPEANFIFGGYSWIKKRFEIWTITYKASERRFVAHAAQWLCHLTDVHKLVIRRNRESPKATVIGKIAFAGDQAFEAKRLLFAKLYPNTNSKVPNKFDMEPFEVVRDMLRDPGHSETIGGSPQIVKVYQYMKAGSLGLYWPDKASGVVHLQGRLCLGYERVDRWILDPDGLSSERPTYDAVPVE